MALNAVTVSFRKKLGKKPVQPRTSSIPLPGVQRELEGDAVGGELLAASNAFHNNAVGYDAIILSGTVNRSRRRDGGVSASIAPTQR